MNQSPASSSRRACGGRLASGRALQRLLPTLILVLSACGTESVAEAPREWNASVVATYPHDPGAFTQGLEWHDGLLYESTGGYGTSSISVSELRTGAVRRRTPLPRDWFGEGITVTETGIWQLTWRDNVALLRDRSSLDVTRQVRFEGEGWGLCHQEAEDRLVMSDGSAELTLRDRSTFSELGTLAVTLEGRPLDRLNELECVDSSVWANVWKRDYIVRIDVGTGRVTDVVHIGVSHPEGDLNGIAALPGTDDLLVTGKNWPSLYRIRLTARPGDGTAMPAAGPASVKP